ncbi:MAG: hypothetical protein KGO50_15860 [Myxococcales bacterium]|nr:hypothetical protein [Myxococcales bacterium]
MSTGPQNTPAARPAENVEVVATQTQDGAFEIQVTRNLSTGATQNGPVNAGAANLGSSGSQVAVANASKRGTGAWKGIAAAVVVALGIGGVVYALISAPPPPPVGEVVAPSQPEATPASTREERRFTVYQGGIYQPRQPVARTATVNFDSIQDEPDTTESDGSGSAGEPTEVVMPDEPAVDGEIPLIPAEIPPGQEVAEELADEVVEQLREVPVEE